MKTMIATVVTAVGASACCIGPVVFSLAGAGALGAASSRLEFLRPVFLVLTAVLLGGAFFVTYRRPADSCEVGSSCPPASNRRNKLLLWAMTFVVVALSAFPYYIQWLI